MAVTPRIEERRRRFRDIVMPSDNLQTNRMVSPVFSSCTYVIYSPSTEDALVIDPGNPDIAPLVESLELHGVKCVPYILLTHEHFDHVGGVNALRQQYQSTVVCSDLCGQAITDPKKNMSVYFDGNGFACEAAEWICEQHGWELPWCDGNVKAFPTPGHSPGGICVVIGQALFTGDTFLGKVKSPTHLPGGNKLDLRESIAKIMNRFVDETVVFPGHGSSFRLGEFRQDTVAVCTTRTLEN